MSLSRRSIRSQNRGFFYFCQHLMAQPLTITMLGTGTSQGVPVIACHCPVCTSVDPRNKRLRSAVMISSGEQNWVIDSGPDFRQQMLREGVERLDAVVFTHEHKDHVAGLDDVRAFNFVMQEDMQVFGTPAVETALHRDFHYAFTKVKYPGVPLINFNTIGNAPFEANGLTFIPIEVMHHKLPVLGFRIGDFTYITDAKTIAPAERDKVRGSKTLVVNALRREAHISHMTLEEALALIEDLQPEQAYLTHISHLLGDHATVEAELPPHVRLAYDGLKFQATA